MNLKHLTCASLQVIAAAMLSALPLTSAFALPSFARQTGMTCAQCHTTFPQLTPFGRAFKLGGYTMSDTKGGQEVHGIFAPLSLMLQTSYSKLSKKLPGVQNGNVQFPQELSLFYGGRITDSLGAFMQATYGEGDTGFAIDNTDIRYAQQTTVNGKPLVYGLTLNNNPTMQDPWNSTPAWGFPFTSLEDTPPAIAGTMIDGAGQQVVGLGAYAQWNNLLYGELSAYHSSTGADNFIKGAAPYWRLALTHDWGDHSVEVGTFGTRAKPYVAGVSGPTSRITDTALDAQYQYLSDLNTFTLRTSWIHEKQNWDASVGAANSSDVLKTFRLNGTYYYKRKWGGSLGYFATSGDTDTGIYQVAATDGSGDATGSPDNKGWIAEVDYLPMLNTKLALQYTRYTKFNGASSNYDGNGRNATDNNALFLNAWLMF